MRPKMAIEKKRFKKLFPHLARQMKEGFGQIHSDASLADMSDDLGDRSRRSSSYEPDVYDFLRRCKNVSEAIELISYMEKMGEITPVIAEALRKKSREGRC